MLGWKGLLNINNSHLTEKKKRKKTVASHYKVWRSCLNLLSPKWKLILWKSVLHLIDNWEVAAYEN